MEETTMKCKNLERVSFQQRLSVREELTERWPALGKFICSTDQVEAAFVSVSNKMDGRLIDIPRGTAEETLDFYNKVVTDGRYIDTMVDNPSEVASKLGIRVSQDALRYIEEVATILRPGSTVMNIAVVAVAVAVTVVIVKGSNPLEDVVIDQSGLVKM